MNGFPLFYVEANIVCVLVFGILLIHNHFNIDRQEKRIKFDHVLTAFMFYFLADSFWALVMSGVIPKTRFTVVLSNFLIYTVMASSIYFWLEFVMAYEHVPHRNRRINKFAVLFPFIISSLALIIHYLIAPNTLVDINLETPFLFTVYLVAVPFIYMGAILFYAIRKSRAEKKASEKRKHLFIGFFPMMIMVGGIFQLVMPYVPIYCFCIMLLMLVFYIQSIELRISMDPLTHLNNRSQLAHYISLKSNLTMEGRLTVAIMMDIDGFKSINDTYGHSEGDRALVIVSGLLKKAVNRHSMPSFICRYGGDEFILIIHPVNISETDRLIKEIRYDLEKASENSPYSLALSIGYDEFGGERDSIQECIGRADKKLYVDKASRNVGRSRHAAV